MYCSVSDIKNKLNNETLLLLTDDDKNGIPDTDIIESAISAGDLWIDALLNDIYEVPFVSVPEIIKNLSAEFAIDELFLRNPALCEKRFNKNNQMHTDIIHKIINGEISLGSGYIKKKNNNPSTTTPAEKIFGSELPEMM